jgi:hydrogenase maturation protease
MPTILVAGMGSELRCDDAFGIIVARRLIDTGTLEGVEVFEAGTAGIGLVQQLFDGYDHLIVIDAGDRGREPGTVYLLEPDIPEMGDYSQEDQQGLLSDMHYTVPNRVLTLARALGTLPKSVYIVGCQPGDLDLGLELSPPVAAAVDKAVEVIQDLTNQMIAANNPRPNRA